MKTKKRIEKLMPRGIPRWIRCYDDESGTYDRYTCVYTGRWRKKGDNSSRCQYVAMSAFPFDPQGIGQHGEHDFMIDVNKWGFAPAIGRKNHLGRRIKFEALPEDCQKLVIKDYKELWSIRAI